MIKKLEQFVTKAIYDVYASETIKVFESASKWLSAKTTLTTIQCLFRALQEGESRANLAARAKALQTKQRCGITPTIPASLNLLVDVMMAATP